VKVNRDLLFTPSIYDAYKWLRDCPDSWKLQAYQAFSNSLNRTKWVPTAKILRGISFEDAVYDVLKEETIPECSPLFAQVVSECRGSVVQKKIKKFETINDQSFCLYGKADAWFPTIIKDIKTTSAYSEKKYRNSIQHPIYCYCENIKDFRYVVAVFSNEETDKKVQRIELIDIHYNDLEEAKKTIHDRVTEFWQFIQNDQDLLDSYLNKFCLY
jgi:hypothetical protein